MMEDYEDVLNYVDRLFYSHGYYMNNEDIAEHNYGQIYSIAEDILDRTAKSLSDGAWHA